jgi:hypothetical protein
MACPSQVHVRHVLSAADIDFIFADVIKSAHTTDITEKQGSAIIMLLNASMAANAAKSDAALDRIIHYVNIWQKAFRLDLQPIVGEEKLRPMADFFRNGVVSRIIFKSPGTNISYTPTRVSKSLNRSAHAVANAPSLQASFWDF